MKVRITDWFLFKDKADLKYIGLEDAVIKTNRTDSTWNYQFIIDHFSSTDTTTTSTPSKKNQGIEFDLKKLDFKNVSLVQADKWRGETMTIRFPTLLLDGNKMDFEKGNLDIAELTIDKMYFEIHNYTGNRIKKPAPKPFSLDIGVLLKIAKLELNDATFVNKKDTDRPIHKYFDGAHMVISRINGTINNFSFNNDTIRGNLDISAKERSGFELKKLKAKFRFDTEMMEFADLDLQTPKSRIRDHYSMHYSDFENDMSDFVDKVLINAKFRQADIHSDDIAYFAPDLKSWNREIVASGNFKGTVNSFKGNNAYVRAGNSTVSGDVSITNVTNINSANFHLSGGIVNTTYNDLAVYVSSIKQVKNPDLRSLGVIRFTGNFDGTINKFTAKGNVATNLGSAYTDVTMNLPKKGEPTYKGAVSTKRFDLGKFLDIDKLGTVSLNGKINGTGFDVNTLKTSFEGNIDELNYGTYVYKSITTNGIFQKGAFAGEVRMNDPNLNFTSNIAIDFNGVQPRFIVLGDVAKADLQALKLSKDKFELAGLFDLDFTGTNIDNFLGSAKLINASLVHDSTRLAFDSLSIQTEYAGNEKVLSIKSNELSAYVRGQYNILDLPNSFQSYLHNYYPSYIQPPTNVPQGQRFTVDITTRNIADYTKILDRKLSGFDNATISGTINTTRPDSGFAITTSVPYFKYDKTAFTGVQFNGIGNATTLKLSGNVDIVTVGDSLYFPNTTINIESANDISLVSIQTKANNTLNEADLNATVTTLEDGVIIDFKPSSFVINDEKWILEKEGRLQLRKNFIAARDIKFTQGFQEITVSTRMPDGGNVQELVVNIKNLHMGDILPFLVKEPRMEGLVSGEVVVTDIFDQLVADANLQADEFRLDNDSIGHVNILANYTRKTGKIRFNIQSKNDPYNLAIEGSFNTKDSTLNPLATTLRLNGTRIGFVNRFLSSIFSDIDGYATGELQMIGDFNRPHLLGKVQLKKGSFKVNYTQVQYFVDLAILDFQQDEIDFGQFILKDKYSNIGFARGTLQQRAFKNMRFDFDLSTNKMLLLDTKPTDNDNFYGRAVGKATLSIRGPEDNIQMSIVGEANDTSHLFIPTGDTRQSAEADFIVFKQYGKEMKPITKASTNLSVDLDIAATNKADIDVILDPITGDVLQAKGNGRLRIHAGTNDPVSIRGRYNIEEGQYHFNFQSLLKKDFIIDPSATNYIEWTGDPYEAQIHVDAQYVAENVSLNDLIANQSLDLNNSIRAYRDKVYVIASLTDKLTSPKINFRFDFPSGTPFKNDYYFTEFLNKMASDPNEMNKQVTYLLVFNTFAPYGEGKNLAQNISALAYNSISQFINRQINEIVSNWLYKITGFKFDINASVYSSASLVGTANPQQNALTGLDRLGLGVKFWRGFANNTIILNIGGNVDLTRPGATAAFQTGNLQLLPDISVEFILDKSGKLRLIAFQRNTLDISTGNTGLGKRNRTGVSLSFSADTGE
jgi:hypothetical protein